MDGKNVFKLGLYLAVCPSGIFACCPSKLSQFGSKIDAPQELEGTSEIGPVPGDYDNVRGSGKRYQQNRLEIRTSRYTHAELTSFSFPPGLASVRASSLG